MGECKWEKYHGEMALICRDYSEDAVFMVIRVLDELLNYRVAAVSFGRTSGDAVLISNRGRGKKVIEITWNDGTAIFRVIR